MNEAEHMAVVRRGRIVRGACLSKQGRAEPSGTLPVATKRQDEGSKGTLVLRDTRGNSIIEPRRPVLLAVALALLTAASLGFIFTAPHSVGFKSRQVKNLVPESELLESAVVEYQRPDFEARMNQSYVEPPRAVFKQTLSEQSSAAVAAHPKQREYTRKQMADRVHSIIRTHAPKHRNARELADAIVAEAKTQQYDPLFVAAVIKSESTFNAIARSHKGAQGLMQIMPQTGAWLAKKEELPKGNLTDPGYNLRLGITYLKHLEELYNGNRVFVLIAYNWGPGHVESASEGKRRVPSEVVTYAVKIMNDFRKWSNFA